MLTPRALALGMALLGIAPQAAGQDHASIAGRVVHKSTKAGIVGAEVFLAPGALRLVTDSAGHFHFDSVPPGSLGLLVRRLGFTPESASFAVGAREDLDVLIELQESPQRLDTVSVAGRAEPIVRGKLAGFYERKRFGIGKFIDSVTLAAAQNERLGDLITSRTPGSRLVRGRLASVAWLATTRDSGARPDQLVLDPLDVWRGADPLACYPDVWIDGVKVYTFGIRAPLFDINSIGTAEVAAVELYVGAARIPVEYNSSSSACGVLLIWTR